MPELTETERAAIEFAALTWKYAGARDAAITKRFGVTPTIFHQRLNALLDRPEALAYDPVTVNRLRRLRDARRRNRSAAKVAQP